MEVKDGTESNVDEISYIPLTKVANKFVVRTQFRLTSSSFE